MLPIKKLYCDTKFKRYDSKSTSDLKIDLPQTIKLPDNCVFYVDDVSIPRMFYTVETGINDKLYFRLIDPFYVLPDYRYNDYIITLDSKDYTGTQFAAEVQSKITAVTGGVSPTCSYDGQSKIMSVSVANLDIICFTDAGLKDPQYVWSGTP